MSGNRAHTLLRRSLVRLSVGLALLLRAVLPAEAAVDDRIARVWEIRQQFNARLKAPPPLDGEEESAASQLAQYWRNWANYWPNWNNWGNWVNWPNWRNW